MDYSYINLKQIENCMNEFQRDLGKLTEEEYAYNLEQIKTLTEKFHNYKSIGLKYTHPEDFSKLISQFYKTMLSIKNKYREIWTEFNMKLMLIGLFIMIICLLNSIFLFNFIIYNIQTECRFISDYLFTFTDILRLFKISGVTLIGFIIVSFVYEIEFLVIFSIYVQILQLAFLNFCYNNAKELKIEILKKEKKINEIKSVFEQNIFGTIIFWGLQISHGYMLFAVSHIRNEGQAILTVLIAVNILYFYISFKENELDKNQKYKNILKILIITILLYFASFYENNAFDRSDITLKKVIF